MTAGRNRETPFRRAVRLVRLQRLLEPPARLIYFAVRVGVEFLAQHA